MWLYLESPGIVTQPVVQLTEVTVSEVSRLITGLAQTFVDIDHEMYGHLPLPLIQERQLGNRVRGLSLPENCMVTVDV